MKSISFDLPYNASASKNRKFFYRGNKHLSPDYVAFRDAVTTKAASLLREKNITFVDHKKVRVDIVLCKTSRMTRTDASNFVEVVCDGIKAAIGVDDCWFSGSYDWKSSAEPLLEIKVSQKR